MSKIARTYYDTESPPPLSDAEREQLARLAAMGDEDIDYSDIPPAKFENAILWRDRHSHPLYRPVKQSTTVRIDADVLLWLKAKGRGYQTRLNAILRDAMVKERR